MRLRRDERKFYDAVEQKMQLEMNSFLKAGTAMNNYTSVLILLLRCALALFALRARPSDP